MQKRSKILAIIQTLIMASAIALPAQAAVNISSPSVSSSGSVVNLRTVLTPTQSFSQNPVPVIEVPSNTTTTTTTATSPASSVVSLKGLINYTTPTATTPATNTPTQTSTTSPVTSGDLVIPTSLTYDEQNMIDMVNQARTDAGLKPLNVDFRLVGAARVKGQDMKDNKYFSHVSPTFGYTASLFTSLGLKVNYTSENLASNKSVSGALAAFMQSPGHRANILDPNVTHIGVGIIYGSVFGNLYVQEFVRE